MDRSAQICCVNKPWDLLAGNLQNPFATNVVGGGEPSRPTGSNFYADTRRRRTRPLFLSGSTLEPTRAETTTLSIR